MSKNTRRTYRSDLKHFTVCDGYFLLLLPCFCDKADPAMDFVDFDVDFERSAFEALVATLRLVVFLWAMSQVP